MLLFTSGAIDQDMKQRALLVFEQSIKSKATLENYSDHLNRFMKFTHIKDYDSLVSIPADKLQTIVEDYVMYLKSHVSPNSVPTLMSGIKHFFIMNRVQLFWDIIHKMYPERIKASGFKPYSTEQISRIIHVSGTLRNKAVIHFLASTGARIGVFNYELKRKQLKEMPEGCKAVLLYAGNIDEYYAFLTPEASKALDEYFEKREQEGEHLTPDSHIFRDQGLLRNNPLTRTGALNLIYRFIKKAGINRTKVNKTSYDIHMDHGFRKRFNTILKLQNDVNSNIAEKIMGHSTTIQLDNRYMASVPLDKLFAEFRKAILELTINQEEKLQMKIHKQQEELSEIETMKRELKLTKARMKRIEAIHDHENYMKKLRNK